MKEQKAASKLKKKKMIDGEDTMIHKKESSLVIIIPIEVGVSETKLLKEKVIKINFLQPRFYKSNEIFNEIYKFVYSNSNETRLSGIGIVSTKDAIKNGLSGPTIRGSGVSLDLRSSGSYLIYTTGEISQVWNIISFTKGDVFARTQVRLWEIHESFEICKLILKGLSTYELKVSEGKSPDKIQFNANKYLYSAVESPNGKLSMILRTGIGDLSDKFNTVRIINNYNFIGLEKTMLLDNEPNDAALIIHSLDLNFNLVDL